MNPETPFTKYNATIAPIFGGVLSKETLRDVDLTVNSDFIEIFKMEIHPDARIGQVRVYGTVIDSAGLGVTYNVALIEVRIIGIMSGQTDIICRGSIGKGNGSILHRTEEGEAYSAIAVEARKIIDGAAGSSVAPATMTCSVKARFFTR